MPTNIIPPKLLNSSINLEHRSKQHKLDVTISARPDNPRIDREVAIRNKPSKSSTEHRINVKNE